ncbi:MAG: caspase family protein [Pseudomonadota bacterium]
MFLVIYDSGWSDNVRHLRDWLEREGAGAFFFDPARSDYPEKSFILCQRRTVLDQNSRPAFVALCRSPDLRIFDLTDGYSVRIAVMRLGLRAEKILINGAEPARTDLAYLIDEYAKYSGRPQLTDYKARFFDQESEADETSVREVDAPEPTGSLWRKTAVYAGVPSMAALVVLGVFFIEPTFGPESFVPTSPSVAEEEEKDAPRLESEPERGGPVDLSIAETRTKRAFIVGVGEYKSITELEKTVGDAQGYEDLFETELGFDVTLLTNPSRAEFEASFGTFLETIMPGDEVVFVFSGHGWSDGAENYLVMADAPRDASEFELKAQTTALTRSVLAPLKEKRPRLTFAIVDACRDYPFDSLTRNAFERGLVRTDVSEGTLILYAAGSRQKALDRLSNTDTSKYSVFTRVLLPKLRDADRPLQDIAREVKTEVRELALTVGRNQLPAYYDELIGDYCLSGPCAGP